jgi:hypothetical protein
MEYYPLNSAVGLALRYIGFIPKPQGLAADSTGNFYVSGLDYTLNQGLVVKFDAAGNTLWTKNIPGIFANASMSMNAIAVDSANGVYVGGTDDGGSYNAILFGADSIKNGAGVYGAHDPECHACWDVGFNETRDYIHARALSCDDKVHANSASHLSNAGNHCFRVFSELTHHQVC